MAIAKDHPHWQRMQFKENKVWMATDAQHQPLLQKGKVLIKYQLDQPHEYWVPQARVSALAPDGGIIPSVAAAARPKRTPKTKTDAPVEPVVSAEACARSICIYTDGACSGNPGPAGIGAVLRYKGKEKEISRYIGTGTNNIAELEAIHTALAAVKNKNLPVILFSDSSYALGLLTRGWKAKENQALVKKVRDLAATFPDLRFVKVKGHAGHPDNERADQLAVQSLNGKR